MNAPASPFARLAPPLAVVFLLGALFGWSIFRETPTGGVHGVAIMAENGKPLAGVDVTLTPQTQDEDGHYHAFDGDEMPLKEGETLARKRRSATTDADGSFTLANVPVGRYEISASTTRHRFEAKPVVVAEGQTLDVPLPMARSSSDLQALDYQKVWTTAETPRIPVDGYIDPNKDLAGDTLHVRIWKARLSSLMRDDDAARILRGYSTNAAYTDPGRGQKEGRLDPLLLHPKSLSASEWPQPFGQFDVPIRSADREGFFTERVKPPFKGPGVYLMEVHHGKDSVVAEVLCTDIGLITKTGGKGTQLLSYAVNLASGKPVPGVTVETTRDGRRVADGVTGADGIASLSLPPPPRPKPKSDDEDDSGDGGGSGNTQTHFVTVAKWRDNEAVVGRDVFQQEDRGQFAVHAYTDRTVYRPGHTVQYKVIVRRKDPAAPGAYAIPVGEPVTIEVRDPSNDRVIRETKTTNRWGTLDGAFDLGSEAPTGMYSLVCTLRGEKHTADIAVASYRKPDFAVTVTPDAPSFEQGDTVSATVAANYYFGTPLAGAKAHYRVYRAPDWSRLYGDSEAGDESGDENQPPPGFDSSGVYGDFVTEGDATLDGSGKAKIQIPTERKRREGRHAQDESDDDSADLSVDYKYTISVTVTDDQSKRQVDVDQDVPVTAGAFTLSLTPEGYAAEPGKPHTLVVRAVDANGKPVPGVDVTVAPSYQRYNPKTQDEDTQTLPHLHATTTSGGSALVTVTPPTAGYLRLDATAYDAKAHLLQSRSELWVADDAGSDLQTEYSDLDLLTDKRHYNPGETARVLVNASRTGESVWLTVEGERVYRSVLVPITKHTTVVPIPVEAGWGPNVYINACYVRDKHYATAQHDLNVRLTEKTLHVAVSTDKAKYRPGGNAACTVRVTDAHNRPIRAELSLSVVDEAIYALRADDPNALRDAFYPRREENGVETDYSFESDFLGDADKSEPKIEMRRKFLDTALWAPHVETDATGTAHVAVPLPDNLTTWRFTAQVCSPDTSVGYGIAKSIVTKPFFVLLDAPRFLTQTDDGQLLALVHNETDAPQTAHVRLQAPGLLPDNDATQTLTLAAGQIGTATFSVKATAIGDDRLRLAAWTDGKDPETGRQYTDGIEQTLPTRAWGREVFTSLAGDITASDTGTEAEDRLRAFTLTPATVLPESTLTVRVTPSLRAAFAPALDYLVGYPYGCTEQTLSRFLPDVLVYGVQRATGGHSLLSGPNAAQREARLPRMVRDGMTRLRALKHDPNSGSGLGGGTDDGGWGWWTDDPDDPALTAYVLYGLAEAQHAGFDVPLLPDAVTAAKKMMADREKVMDRDRPFLLYALADAGEREFVAAQLREIFSGHAAQRGRDALRLDRMEPDRLAYLTLAAHLSGVDPGPAWEQLQARGVREGRLLHWKVASDRWDTTDIFATALGLRALLAVAPGDGRIGAVVRWLMANRTDDYWSSTRDTSTVLAAFCEYLHAHPADAAPPSGTVAVRVNGKDAARIDLGANADERETVVRVPPSLLVKGRNTLEVVPESGAATGAVFWSAGLRALEGVPDGGSLPPITTQPGITVKREYLRVAPEHFGIDGFRLKESPAGPDNRYAQGDEVRVRLTITAPRPVSYVLIEDRFPSNLEITERGTAELDPNDNSGEEGGAGGGGRSDWYSDVDVRDDRIVYFAATLPKGTSTLEYHLRARTPGTARALPAQLQAMYDPLVRAESGDEGVTVK